MNWACAGVSGLRNVFLLILLSIVAGRLSAQQLSSYPYYYVVVGGFASEKNAQNFTKHVHELNFPARYAFNANRKLFYVYVRITKDKQKARETTYRLRLETEFRKAWIYNGPLEGDTAAESMAEAERAEAAENGDAVNTTPVVIE